MTGTRRKTSLLVLKMTKNATFAYKEIFRKNNIFFPKDEVSRVKFGEKFNAYINFA